MPGKAMKARLIRPLLLVLPLLAGCANFRHLAADLKPFQDDYRISGIIENADDYQVPVRVAVIEWDRADNKIYSGDRVDLAPGGAFVFSVKSPLNQHLGAFADNNRDGRWQKGEAAWMHEGPLAIDGDSRTTRVRGRLSTSNPVPPELVAAVDQLVAGGTVEETITHRGIRFAAGEIVDLDDPRFAATRGADGLWTPATLAIRQGFGVYFLERYDPSRIPVLFVHGAAGSPQDWRTAMEKIDRRRYQPWFYFYPSGGRLEAAAGALNEGVKRLHERFGFQRMDVVAHSMGGLVSRRFVIKNVIEDGNGYIRNFITFSTPWDGHEAAAMGVKWAPTVVPSWYDMKQGSDFLDHLFDRRLKGKVNYHLFYSHHAKRSPIMPAENDGTVSVPSQLRAEAKAEASSVQGYDEDHVSILSARAPLLRAKQILDAAR
jgi:pimeloyl-ACP methyl ester carboxylesterase